MNDLNSPVFPEEEVNARLCDLVKPLTKLYHTDAIVQEVAKAYAHGVICTKEEALYQMVKGLASVLDRHNKNVLEWQQSRPWLSAPGGPKE